MTREEAIKVLNGILHLNYRNFWDKECDEAIDMAIEALQFADKSPLADRLQGEWLKFGLGRGTRILFCTNCERRIEVPLSQGDSNYDFCPNCGARMKGADDE